MESGRVRFSVSTLRGRPTVRELEVSGLRLSLARSADGKWNLPESAPGAVARPLDLRPLLHARIAVRGATVHLKDAAAGFEGEAKQLRFDWSGDLGRGALAVGEDVRWRRLGDAGDWRGRVALQPATLVREGPSVTVQGPTLVAPEGRLAFAGAIDDVEGTPRLRAQAEGHADIGHLAGAPWRGRLALRANAAGPLDDLALEIEAQADRVAVADLPLVARVSARTEKGAWLAEGEGRLAEGRFTISARLPTAGEARAEARWNGLDVARLLHAVSPAAAAAVQGGLAGSLVATWPLGTDDLKQLTVEGESAITPHEARAEGPLAWRGRTSLRLRERAYVVELDHRYGDAATVTGRVAGRLHDGRAWAATLSGPLRITVERPDELLRAAGIPVEGTLALAGRLEATLTLGGTVEAPEAGGPLRVRDLEVYGGPPIGVDAHILLKDGRVVLDRAAAGGAGLEATGSLTLGPGDRIAGEATTRVASLAQWPSAFPARWAPTGRVEARVSLSGAASRPAVVVDSFVVDQGDGRLEATGTWERGGEAWSLRATANDFALAPIEDTATNGTVLPPTARLDGQIFALRAGETVDAGGTLTLDRITWQGRPVGTGTFELSSTGATLDAELRVADLGASASVRLEPTAPFPVRAELRLVETPLGALANVLGASGQGASGTATLSATWEGEAARPDQGRVKGELVRLDGVARGVRFRIPHPARWFAARERVGLEGLELQGDGFQASLTGALSETGEETLELLASGDLAGFDPLLKTDDDASVSSTGRFELRARVGGTPGRPRPEGALTLSEGSVRRDEEILLENVVLVAGLREGTLLLERLDAQTTGLRFNLTGEAGAGLLTSSDDAARAWPGFLREALRGSHHGRLQLRVQTREAPQVPPRGGRRACPRSRGRLYRSGRSWSRPVSKPTKPRCGACAAGPRCAGWASASRECPCARTNP